MGVGPVILLGNPLSDSRAGREAGCVCRLGVGKERNREADFREESVILADGSTGQRRGKTHPLPDFFLSQVGPTPILQNSLRTVESERGMDFLARGAGRGFRS